MLQNTEILLHLSHCAEALSSVALARNTLKRELVFLVAWLLLSRTWKRLAVASITAWFSELKGQLASEIIGLNWLI